MKVRIDERLRAQAGVISRDQAMADGMSRYAVDRRLAIGAWRPVHPAVYLAEGHRYTREARLRAAVLWAGPGAAASGAWAAWWHGMTRTVPEWIVVTLPVRSGRRSVPGVRVRRRDLLPVDVETWRGVRVTAAPLTALDAAVELGANGPALLDRALARSVGYREVCAAHSRQIGCLGSRRAGRLLAAAGDRAGSSAERLLIRVLRNAGVTGWRPNHRSCGYLIDLAFPGAMVAVEVDGWAWHVDAERFVADRRRQNALVNAGWTVLRFTWHDLTGRPDEVLAEIVAVL